MSLGDKEINVRLNYKLFAIQYSDDAGFFLLRIKLVYTKICRCLRVTL